MPGTRAGSSAILGACKGPAGHLAWLIALVSSGLARSIEWRPAIRAESQKGDRTLTDILGGGGVSFIRMSTRETTSH